LASGENTLEIKVTSNIPDSDAPAQDTKPAPAGLAALVKTIDANGEVRRYASDDRWEANLEGTSSWTRPQIIGDLTDTRMGNPGALPQPAFYLRKTIQLSGTVRRARLYVTALGSYKFFVNARGVGDGVLTPEFTDYRKRVIYQSYDVTN